MATVPTAVLRRRLGCELRKLREARSLRLEDVAEHLGVAASTLSRIETGKAPARAAYVHPMLDLYDLRDEAQRLDLIETAREGQRRSWWAGQADVLPAGAIEYLGLEAAAGEIFMYCDQSVPGLVQVPGYALAAAQATYPDLDRDQVSRLALVQARRQELLTASGHVL